MKTILFCFCLSFAAWPVFATNYMSRDDFLRTAFNGQEPEQKMLWLDGAQRGTIEKILGHPYRGLRIRYWSLQGRSAWILDEIGKEKPITIGVLTEQDRVTGMTMLAFRETRGSEVRYEFFTRQFLGVGLGSDLQLDRNIDGITGATLSVRAVTDIAALALYLNRVSAAGKQLSSDKQVEGLQ